MSGILFFGSQPNSKLVSHENTFSNLNPLSAPFIP